MKKILNALKNSNKIKRWILLTLIGMILICFGITKVITVEKLFFDDILKAILYFVVGCMCAAIGIVYIQRRTLAIALEGTAGNNKASSLQSNSNDKGPKIVVIGGGTGLNNVLKGLKNYTSNLTAIVTVSTYGSKTRKPTEDIKESIIALAENSDEMQKVINFEFDIEELKGIDLGDLYLTAAANIYGGFVNSIEKSSNILSMIGRALPVTLDEMHISAELDNGMVIEEKDQIAKETESKITKINRVFLTPTNCRVAPGVLEAIQEADAIVIGPGNLYTNVIPNLLVKNVAKTIKESKAKKIYISNIMTEPGFTDDYDLSEHLKALEEHVGKNIVDYCICDNGEIIPEFLRKYNKEGADLVHIDSENIKSVKIIKADVSCIDGEYIRHNSENLAREIVDIICNELKYKDKQNDEQYILLNSKLKEKKKKDKKETKKKPKQIKKKENAPRKKSKFASKYKDRIDSIQHSEETRMKNIKLQEEETEENK